MCDMRIDVKRTVHEMRDGGKSIAEIASAIGKSERTAARYVKQLGLTKSLDRTDILDSDVLELWNKGFTITEIAGKFGCAHDTIEKRLAKFGVSCDRTEGIRRHFERTRDDLWPGIKSDLDSGMSATAVAGKHHMRYETVQRLMDAHLYDYLPKR